MLNLLIKLVAYPAVVILSDYLFAGVYFRFLFQAILVGVVLAFVGHVSELYLLKRGTLWASTIFDVIAAATVLFLSPYLLPGAYVTFGGAFLAALLLGVVDYFQHLWLIYTGRTRKNPA